MEKVYELSVNVFGTTVEKTSIFFMAGDKDTYVINFNLYEQFDSKPPKKAFVPEPGSMVILNFKPDNSIRSSEVEATIVDAETGRVSVKFANPFEVTGNYVGTLRVEGDTETLTFGQRFSFTVAASPSQR